jgi:hypothetical protein
MNDLLDSGIIEKATGPICLSPVHIVPIKLKDRRVANQTIRRVSYTEPMTELMGVQFEIN